MKSDLANKRYEMYKSTIEEYLDRYLPVQYPEKTWESMRYSVLAGGKRIRPVIALEVCNALCGNYAHAIPTACAIEMLHVYSLIHDDLPCMDNDDFRRGKLTNHKVFGEAIALLAGDALITYALQVIMQKSPKTVKAPIITKIIEEYLISAGAEGMVGGQVVDIESEGKEVSKDTLNYIHRYKTAELFKLSFRTGAILGGADEKQLENITEIALLTGNAFQIADDILDVVSTKEKLGKTPGKDLAAHKATYVSLYGLDEAKNKLNCLCKSACDKIIKYGIKSDLLVELINKINNQIN